MGDTKLAKVGITVKEPWAAGISYEALDYTLWRVQDGGDGCGYIAKKDNIGIQPGSDDETWVKAAQAGQSIYDLAVKYGHFDGTEEEFEAQYQAALAAANSAAAAASETNTQIQNAETLRVSAESGRVSAETARVDAESRRVSAEQTRDNNETARTAAEAVRASSETGRVSAENGRVSAESGRVSAESARVSAENERRADFESLETDMRTAIGQADAATETAVALNEQVAGDEADRVSAEQARVSAESARVSAETARALAETARETQAGNDHTRAESDHSTAASDHTTAGQDHTQAGTDHTRSESDHTQAGADHTQAVADHTASEAATTAANTAAAAADAAREGIQDELDQKANKDGYYGGMTVGSAENLVGRGTVEAEYAGVRTSAGTADIGSGSAAISRMKGQSFVWNQMQKDVLFENPSLWSGSGTRNYEDGVAIITAAANGSANTYLTEGYQQIAGHKYYLSVYAKAEEPVDIYYGNTQNTFHLTNAYQHCYRFLTAQNSNKVYNNCYVYEKSAFAGKKLYLKHYQIIDLTLLFGAGNEPSTVEEFDAWRAEMGLTLDYYAYNPGEVINNKAAGILTRGFNLYNPSTGKAFLPGPYSDYPHEYEICGTFESISFTDINGNTSVPTLTDGKFFNVDAPGELTVVGGNNTDTLVHLVWSGWRNQGEPDYAFEPYWENTLNLNLTQLTGKLNGAGDSVVVFPNGLAKIGDVQDEIVGNKAIKRIGVVDMGTPNWGVESNNAFSCAAVTLGAKSVSKTLCGKYDYVGIMNIVNMADKTISNGGSGLYIIIRDTAYSDLSSFKTGNSGVLLYYELATPQEYTLDVSPDWNYRVDDFGTEQVIPSYDPSNLTAPISYDVQYAMNAVDAIRRLPDNYVERSDVKQTIGQSEKHVLSQKGVDANYAKKVGVENDLVVGAAKALAGNQRQVKEFSTMVMDGADGIAKINEAMGKSLVWNQLQTIPTNDSTTTINGITIKDNRDGSYTLNGTATGDVSFNCPNWASVATHKYYLSIGAPSVTGVTVREQYSGTTYGQIKQLNASVSNRYAMISIGNGTVVDNYRIYPQTFDLTQMFGAGNEPATVVEFEKLFPLPYYAYNAGTIISNATESLGVTGFNQWDEEWELGAYDSTTGIKYNSPTQIRSTNKFPILPNTNYYKKGSTGVYWCVFFDKDGNYLSRLGQAPNSVFTTPNGAYYMAFWCETAYGTTYNHDICINLSDPNRNGTYEPYKHADLPLNLSTITGKLNGEGESVVIFPDGLRSAGTVYDSLLVDEDGYARKAVKRMGKVDLGDLTWVLNNVDFPSCFRSIGIDGIIKPNDATTIPNLLCNKYLVDTRTRVVYTTVDKAVGCGGVASPSGAIYISDSAYSGYTVEQVKASLSGVELIYELATYETYDLDEPIPMTFMAHHGGTITQTPQAPESAPMRMNVTFAIDAVSTINGLPQNYVSKESLQAMLAAMQSAGIFSGYTMTFNATTGKYEFTFTVSNS